MYFFLPGYVVSESTVSVGSYSLTLIATDTCQNTVTGTTSVKVINTVRVVKEISSSFLEITCFSTKCKD